MIGLTVKRKSNLDKIVSGLKSAAAAGLESALKDTQQTAIEAKDKAVRYPDEILDSEIKVEILGDGLKGKVYTDGERVLFVEYGTGTFAELPHIGKTKTFIESNYSMWLLPVDKAPVDFGAEHRITIGYIDYFVMLPTQPTHFFSTAGFIRRDDNVEAVRRAIIELLKKPLERKA